MDIPLAVVASSRSPPPSPPPARASYLATTTAALNRPPDTLPLSRSPPPNAPTGPRLPLLSTRAPLSPHMATPQPCTPWDCDVCQRTLLERERIQHIASRGHRKRQVAFDTQRATKTARLAHVGAASQSMGSTTDAVSRVVAAPPEMWKCVVCEWEMMAMSKQHHLGGAPHSDNLARRDEMVAKRLVEEQEVRRLEQVQTAEAVPIAEETRRREEGRQEEEKRLEMLQRKEQIRVAAELQQESERMLEAQRQRDFIRIAGEMQQAEEQLEELRQTTEPPIVELNRRTLQQQETENLETDEAKQRAGELLLAQEQDRSDKVTRAQRDQECAATADQQLSHAQNQERKEWMRMQVAEMAAAWQVERQRRFEQEERRVEWVRMEEEKVAAAWRVEEQVRLEEQNRRKRWMRIQEVQVAASWREEERLSVEEQHRRMEWEENREEETAAAWQGRDHLRLQQEKHRMESRSRLEAAAEYTHLELLRKSAGEEETRRTVELAAAEEQANAQRIAEQERMESEVRRIAKQKLEKQDATRLALEHVEMIQGVGPQGEVVLDLAGYASATDATGEGLASAQIIPESAGFVDSGSDDWTLHYWQEETSIQEMYQPQMWMQPTLVMTLPMPVMSLGDISPILFRVYDETSVSRLSSDGFTAGACCMPSDSFQFRNMVNLHGNWSSREKTPFISVTSSPEAAAWHVTIRQATRSQRTITVALIDTFALLSRTGVWKMHDARNRFGLQPWKCHPRAFDNEYICNMRIPAAAIIACCRPEYFRQTAMMFLNGVGRIDRMDTEGESAA